MRNIIKVEALVNNNHYNVNKETIKRKNLYTIKNIKDAFRGNWDGKNRL